MECEYIEQNGNYARVDFLDNGQIIFVPIIGKVDITYSLRRLGTNA